MRRKVPRSSQNLVRGYQTASATADEDLRKPWRARAGRNLRFRAIGSCLGGEALSDPAPNSFAGLIANGGEAQASNLICFVHPGKLADCFDALAGIEREPAKDRTISMHRGNSLKPKAFL